MQKKRFSYADYELACRSGGYHVTRRYLGMIAPIFQGCHHVLDIGCGQGIFLELLNSQDIGAVGIDSNPNLVETAQKTGSRVIRGDALDYLKDTDDVFDGLFCAHLIEHLPFEQVLDLLEGACMRLAAGGVFVLVFPNPASLQMQLNYFWRDPTHVRFYQRDLIVAILTHYGLKIDSTYPSAISWGWTSLYDGIPTPNRWLRLRQHLRAWLRHQLEIDHDLLNQPEDVLIVARKEL